MAAQLAAEVTLHKKSAEGLQTLVSTREDEARGKRLVPYFLFLALFDLVSNPSPFLSPRGEERGSGQGSRGDEGQVRPEG